MHTASDGKSFTNRPPMMAHERSLSRKSQAGGAGMSKPDPLAQPTQGGEMGGEDGAQVAQQHGPAVEVNVMHNHEAGEHHVSSKHPDGHMHESMHGSAEEAHEHAKKLATPHDGEMESEQEEPEYE